MKRIKVNEDELEEYDVTSGGNDYIFEDIYDEVFGAEEWVEDSGSTDVVGFVSGEPVVCSTHNNSMSFAHIRTPSANINKIASITLAKEILRRIGDALERVLRDVTDERCEYSTDDVVNGTFEDESGIIVKSEIDNSTVTMYFYQKLTT